MISDMFEREPMEKLARRKQLVAYKHNGFWYAMDSLKDKEYLEKNHKKIMIYGKYK